MGRKKKKNSKRKKDVEEIEREGLLSGIDPSTKQWILMILFTVIGLFLTVASFDKAGVAGEKLYELFKYLLGVGYFMLPMVFFVLALSAVQPERKDATLLRALAAIVFFFSGLGLVSLFFPQKGGIVGSALSAPLMRFFDITGSLILLCALVLISLLIIFETRLTLRNLLFWRKRRDEEEDDMADVLPEEAPLPEEPVEEEVPVEEKEKPFTFSGMIGGKKAKEEKRDEVDESEIGMPRAIPSSPSSKEYVPPPLSLLERDSGKPGVGDIKSNANLIKRTLQNFGIQVEMDEISIGPTVTRYAFKPAEGVRLSRILGLQNNLELALAAHPVRIEAPIPGKSLVGIEVPNSSKTTVGLAGLLSDPAFRESQKPLMISLGKGITGKSQFADLAKAPHMLIAGATGSGKSVTIHAIIASLLFRNSPEDLKFIMVDPKRVELTLYNEIPHLLTPVITEAKKAILALKWAAKEMDRRYNVLQEHKVRDIGSYHATVLGPALKKHKGEEGAALPERMPYVVIVIDELADIMQAYPRELESAIVRLAQMSRAVGIHLMLSTQRPSVNVVTGLIKANVPSRIALQVASQVDSKTILDAGGAEKLLGAGDMLYQSGEMSKPIRLQSAFISEKEVKSVTNYLRKEYADELPDEVDIETVSDPNALFSANLELDGDMDDEDELLEEAREIVVRAGKASTSYIQRKLRVGYARAARLMDLLEDQGVIGPADGSRPREVLIKGSESELAPEEE